MIAFDVREFSHSLALASEVYPLVRPDTLVGSRTGHRLKSVQPKRWEKNSVKEC